MRRRNKASTLHRYCNEWTQTRIYSIIWLWSQIDDYGYADGKPCVAVKMNRVFEFMPEIEGGGDDILIECIGKLVSLNLSYVATIGMLVSWGILKLVWFMFKTWGYSHELIDKLIRSINRRRWPIGIYLSMISCEYPPGEIHMRSLMSNPMGHPIRTN